MSMLRLALVGTVSLVLLGGLGGVVVAQDEEALASYGPHKVSGTSAYSGEFGSFTGGWDDGRLLQRGYGAYDTIEMDDPRLSGTMWHVWNRDYLDEGQVLTGTVELVNDDGSWVGTMRGYRTHEPGWDLHYWQIELLGTGAYEGHSALLYTRGVTDDTHDVEGFVFPGALPEYPDPVEVSPQ